MVITRGKWRYVHDSAVSGQGFNVCQATVLVLKGDFDADRCGAAELVIDIGLEQYIGE